MENKFIRVDEVAQELSVSKPYAYKLIKKLNDELKEKGFITIAGRVNRQYFQERLYGAGEKQCQRQFEIVRKRRRNFVVFRRGG